MFQFRNNNSSSSSDINLPLLPQPYCSAPANASGFYENIGSLSSANCYSSVYNLSPPSQSPPSNYCSSLPSNSSHHLLRTSSTLSLHTHISEPNPHVPFFSSSSPSSSDHLNCDFFSQPVRRVFSTGDLQGMNSMQASVENVGQEGNGPGAAARVGRYSAEERKEKIERYRSKRNHRNFQKKITYACRKTLADSRPRVRGRFARNGEIEVEADQAAEESTCYEGVPYSYNASWDQYSYMNGYEEPKPQQQAQLNYSSSNFDYNNSGGSNGSNDSGTMNEWCRQMQAALAAEVEEDEGRRWAVDEDTWANYLDVLSMNLLS